MGVSLGIVATITVTPASNPTVIPDAWNNTGGTEE